MTASAAGRETKQAIKEEIQYHFKPYGFIRSYAFFDSRATKSLAEDMFFFIPLDEDKLFRDLNGLMEAAYLNDEELTRKEILQTVPTYHPEKAG